MIAKQKEARAAGGKGPAGAGPGGTLTSFTEGLQELIDALSSSLGERARTSRPTVSVDTRPGEEKSSFDVTLEGGDRVPAEAVVIATPAYAAGSILGNLAPEAAELLRAIPYSAVSVVHFGLDPATAGHDLNGFGFLIPHSEGRKILGSLWSSSIFPNRAPDGRALVTTMIGGARDPRTPLLDDESLTEVVRGELQTAMNQSEAPLFSLLTRWEKGIPQYAVGHEERLLKIEKNLSRPGLFLVGNAYRGIGVNDCVKAAQLLAPKVVRYLGSLS
jgi:oxygen-dependent protoporphyrinogen oxidase